MKYLGNYILLDVSVGIGSSLLIQFSLENNIIKVE